QPEVRSSRERTPEVRIELRAVGDDDEPGSRVLLGEDAPDRTVQTLDAARSRLGRQDDRDGLQGLGISSPGNLDPFGSVEFTPFGASTIAWLRVEAGLQLPPKAATSGAAGSPGEERT